MPSSVTVYVKLNQKAKMEDSSMQVSLFLYDLQIADYALLCGKCVFNRGIMYLLVSAAFKLPQTGNYDDNLLPYGPYASFVGKIYEAVVQHENDCKFGVNLLEYNNFSFGNKERMDFKIQVVYEAGPNLRFKKIIAPKLNVEKLVYISGFFDLNENELPFVEAKKIDLLDDYSNNLSQNQSNINEMKASSNTEITNNDEQMQDVVIKKEDLSLQRLKKAAKKTNVRTRSQKEKQKDDIILTESEENA
ncbi:unnamed protein product [Rhizophagus irregularis]|uniref:Uncharacterized protein n=2 Tax=Rhizophagus irregularis TaxID=588596 RepID=A0A916E1Y8_9GLOM|nr:unnamed protein product [Rhizophagus irregularis]CAB5128368.1 unnamed protein product [Rhizophagus irregularis]CAB5354959.1 unnamed protein product [Rhizophagus irregularis]